MDSSFKNSKDTPGERQRLAKSLVMFCGDCNECWQGLVANTGGDVRLQFTYGFMNSESRQLTYTIIHQIDMLALVKTSHCNSIIALEHRYSWHRIIAARRTTFPYYIVV